VVEIIDAEGAEIAFPTSTIHLAHAAEPEELPLQASSASSR
jgi:hypothetical protein